MFDKNYMMEDEYSLYLTRCAEDVPVTPNRLNEYIRFISSYVRKQNKIIKHYEAEGKDTTHAVYEKDLALSALGLIEKPVPCWRDHYSEI